jgi:hypothetical protein
MHGNCQAMLTSADLAVGYRSGLATAVWLGTTWPHHAASLRAAVEAAHALSAPGKVWLLQVVAPGAVAPDARSRSALAAMLASFDGIVSHSAVIYIGAGFRASIIRSIVTGLNAMGRQRFPHRVFANLNEAVNWFASNGLSDPAAAYKDLQDFYEAAIAGRLGSDLKRAAGSAR